ncbi:MAG: hypothetical protein MI922_29270 [Bacteroidales bacterium]|nr:hypothetical protein [Bacteroidales bacterium]
MKFCKYLTIALTFSLLAISCKKEELGIDKFSDKVKLQHQGALPLVQGKFNFDDFVEADEDSILVINGDTLTLYYREDSVFTFNVGDFTSIPDQDIVPFVISPSIDIPLALLGLSDGDSLTIDSLGQTSPYTFDLDSMRLDKILLNTGALSINVENQFTMNVKLVLSSTNLVDPSQNTFSRDIRVPAGQSVNVQVPLDDYDLIFSSDTAGEIVMNLEMVPTFYKRDGEDWLMAGDSLILNFGVEDVNDYEAIFGYFGQYLKDTTVTFPIDGLDNYQNITGTFNVTDPKLNILYDHSFGLPMGVDLAITAHHTDKPDVLIDPNRQIIPGAVYSSSPLSSGEVSFNKNTVTNIDELIAFPVPDSLTFSGRVQTNPDGEITNDTNFVRGDSEILIGVEVEMPMEFSANLTYLDTLTTEDLIGEDSLEIAEIEYLRLHHKITNGFPLGIDLNLVMYDSINDITYPDTIAITGQGNKMFFDPAPVGLDGYVDKSQLVEEQGVIEITGDQADFFLDESTHFIVILKFQTYNYASARILFNYAVDFAFGVEYKLTYESE